MRFDPVLVFAAAAILLVGITVYFLYVTPMPKPVRVSGVLPPSNHPSSRSR
jgi:hypothetical protein